jgi:hypothetical protein
MVTAAANLGTRSKVELGSVALIPLTSVLNAGTASGTEGVPCEPVRELVASAWARA